jgi:hypothetical protein
MPRRRRSIKGAVVFFCALLCFFSFLTLSEDKFPPLDLRSIPISAWLNGGDHADIPWDLRVSEPFLRVDQRLEVLYSVKIDAKAINKAGSEHELFLISRVSTPDGEWLNQPSIVRETVDQQLANRMFMQFSMHVIVQPGDYVLWVVLYDRKTGKHNVTKRHFKVGEVHGDPLPNLYSRMPLVEFPEFIDIGDGVGASRNLLYLPVRNKQLLDVQLISMLSPPEQWTGRSRVVRAHSDDTIGALAALSQMEMASGTISVTGLDLVRRQILFQQHDFKSINWSSLMGAMKKAVSPDISAGALQGSKNNGAFFRDFLDRQIGGGPAEGGPLRVFIVVTSSTLFESGADLRPIQIEGDCRCRVYYLRFRLNANDVFDQLEKFMKPLRPRTFNLVSARDLRKAIAEIVEEMEKL